jgi:hypothetical protein
MPIKEEAILFNPVREGLEPQMCICGQYQAAALGSFPGTEA